MAKRYISIGATEDLVNNLKKNREEEKNIKHLKH
jgi:hypothetical protein